MSELNINNLLKLTQKYRQIYLGFIDYWKLINTQSHINNLIEIELSKINLIRGLYAKINGCNIWMDSKYEHEGFVKVSNDQIYKDINSINWSDPFPLKYAHDLNRMKKLKLFW